MDRFFRKYIYTDHLQHSAHTLVNSEGLIENGHHQVCADGDPDLSLHGVFAQAVEGFDAKVLLDPLEEELDLPAGFVDLRDHDGVDLEVVGDEDQAFSGFGIQKAYSAQVATVEAFGSRSVETNRLIGSQADGLVYRARFANVVAHVDLRSGHEERQSRMNPIEPSEIDVSAIHYIEGSSFEYYPIQGVDVVDLSFGDRHECRDGSVQIDHSMEFDGGLPLSKSSPREEAHAQVYRGSVDSVDDLVDLRDVSIRCVQFSSLANENLSEFEIDAPVARFVGVGKIGSSYQPAYAHRVEQFGLGTKACFDVAQAFPESQLSESHAKELIPCRKALALSGHGIIGYATIELFPMDHIDNLRENETICIHAFQSQQGSIPMKSKSNASHQYFHLSLW